MRRRPLTSLLISCISDLWCRYFLLPPLPHYEHRSTWAWTVSVVAVELLRTSCPSSVSFLLRLAAGAVQDVLTHTWLLSFLSLVCTACCMLRSATVASVDGDPGNIPGSRCRPSDISCVACCQCLASSEQHGGPRALRPLHRAAIGL